MLAQPMVGASRASVRGLKSVLGSLDRRLGLVSVASGLKAETKYAVEAILVMVRLGYVDELWVIGLSRPDRNRQAVHVTCL